MKAYTNVSRKTVGEDHIAICPEFGCEFMTRVKPLKFGFLGFGKYPKCKKHHIPLVYIDERIGDFVDAALACLFDKAGLPPDELLELIKSKFPDEFTSFAEGWLYCITVGRGAPIVSQYLDSISNAYLKQLTKKQIKTFKKGSDSKPNLMNKAIREGMDEITIQYTRVLKHLRIHSEILIEHQKLKTLSKSLRNCLNNWQNNILKCNHIINSSESKREMTLRDTKFNYDQILNIGTCRCLLGLNPESKTVSKAKISAFDRFSAYYEFYNEGLTMKFNKSDIKMLMRKIHSKSSASQMTEINDSNPNEKELMASNIFLVNGKTLEIYNFEPSSLIILLNDLGEDNIDSLEVKDQNYLQKSNKYSISPLYSDGDIEFWIKTYKLMYYGESWPKVFNLIRDFNKHLNLKINIPYYYNDMPPIVKRYCEHFNLNYEELLLKHGIQKTKNPPSDKDIIEWIKIYQDPEIGGSISAIRNNLEKHLGYTYGETTIRRHIKNFFQKRKYAKYFGTNLTYEGWMTTYKRTYFREEMPLDPKTQSHEYILLYNSKTNQYQRVFIKDLENPELLENLNEFQILGISRKLQPEKVNISRFVKGKPQESLEITCSHGSVIITPDQFVFTIDDDGNIIEVKGSDLKVGMPILMPRILRIDPNDEPLDLINCGKLINKNNVQYIEQFAKNANRFVKKNAKLGEILGQYAAEGTIPSKFQPGTVISVSTDKEYIQKLQKTVKEVFELEFQIQAKRVLKCKNCGSKTIEKGKLNICPKCEDGVYNEIYELKTKTKLAKAIFTEGLGLKHAYSYSKELPSILYNSPPECEKGFILSYFKGDGSELDYRYKGGTFELNFVTTSRRLVFGLNFLMKKLGVIMNVRTHKPSNRPNSKKLYQMNIRGSSNFEKLKPLFDKLPELNFSTSDIKTAANTQALIRKLNLELQKMRGISLRDLSNKGIIPKNALHIATQLKRKTNLSEVLLLKTLDGLKNEKISTPLVEKLENIFRNNTFTRIKKIRSSKIPKTSYIISVEGLGYCSGTAFIYVKSKKIK